MGNMQDNPCKWIRGGSLMWDLYREFEEDDEVYSMLDVVKTTCSLCGSPMNWAIEHDFNDKTDTIYLHATAYCCGIKFYTEFDNKYKEEAYILKSDHKYEHLYKRGKT